MNNAEKVEVRNSRMYLLLKAYDVPQSVISGRTKGSASFDP